MEGRKEERSPNPEKEIEFKQLYFLTKNSLLLKGISREPDLDKLFNLMSFTPSLQKTTC